MPKRGKGDLFNIDNIEEAIKAIEEIYNIIQKTGVSAQQWMNDNEEIVKKYNELKRLSADLFKQDEMAVNARNQKFRNEIEKYHEQIKYREQQIEQEVQLRTEVEKRLQAQKEIVSTQKEQENAAKQSLQYQKQLSKEMQNYNIELKKWSPSNFLSKRQDKLQSDVNKRTTQILDDWVKNNGNITESNYEEVQKVLQTTLNKEFGGRAFGLNLAAQGLQEAGELLQKGIRQLTSLFTTGINNQSNAYENTFTNISVRNGTTRSQYYGAQARVNNILGDMGLRNNIATSQVQEMWNTLASEGIKVDLTDQETTTKAIETILTNQIVPYLDMSSSYMQKLATDNPNLMKQVRGIGTSIQNVEGSNVVANDYLQDMMDSLSPMAELAEQEIGLQYADALGQLENLRNQGYSDSQIGELYNSLKTMVEDPYKALTSGDTLMSMTVADVIGSGKDLKDSGNMLRTYMYNLTGLANSVPEGNWSSLYGGILANNFGGGSAGLWTTTNEKNINAFLSSQAGYSASSGVNSAASAATSAFTNDQNQTNKTLQNITLENLMNELSVINEWMGNWSTFIVNAIQGLGNIILSAGGMALGGKLLGGKGTSLLGGIKGGAKNLAGKVTGGLAKIGTTTSGNASALAGLGNLASVAGGAYLGYQGFSNMASDISTGDTDFGTGLSAVQGVAGTTAAMAGGTAIGASLLGASGVAAAAGPVGWAALAIAGVAAVTKGIYDTYKEYSDAGKSQLDEMNKQVDEEVAQRQETQREQISAMTTLRDEILQNNDVEQAKRELLENGLITQEEYNNAQVDSKDELKNLTDAYIDGTKKINEASNAIYSEIHKQENEELDPYIQKTKEFMDSVVKGVGQQKMYEMDDAGRATTESTVRALYDYYSTADNLSEDEQKIFDKMSEYMSSTYSDLTWEDIDDIVNTMDNNKTAMRTSINKALQNSTRTQQFTSGFGDSWAGNKVTEQLGLDAYVGMDTETATSALNSIMQAVETDKDDEISKDTIKSYIDTYKNATGQTDYNSLSGQAKNYIDRAMEKYNISSYRQGTNEVPEDQLAYLHQGEAVLTASTANELRNLTDTYRETTTQSYNLDAIIQSQTSSLITKMDEIIRAITTGTSTPTSDTNKASSKLWNSLTYIQSTKNF